MHHICSQIQSPDAVGVNGETRAKGKNFYKACTSKDLVYFACFMCDTLVHLSSLSAKLQKNTVCIADVHRALEATRAILNKYKERLVILIVTPATYYKNGNSNNKNCRLMIMFCRNTKEVNRIELTIKKPLLHCSGQGQG